MPMAKAYSDNLRRKLIEAHQAGEGSLETLARRFHVSVGWTKKVSATFRRTGSPARPPSGPPGGRGRFGSAIQQQPRQWIGEQPDLTLDELQARLRGQSSMAASMGRLWNLLREGTLGGWRTLTILGAMRRGGRVAAMTIEAATDGDISLAFLEPVLCPRLRWGDVVVMDNLAAHKIAGVRERVEGVGAELLYLPPDSPDFHPIESCWAEVKPRLRAAQARSLSRLESCLDQALAAVTAQAIPACFRHCGYGL